MKPHESDFNSLESLVERYVSGSASAEEREFVERQVLVDPTWLASVNLLQASWEARLDAEASWNTDRAIGRFQEKIRAEESGRPQYRQTAKDMTGSIAWIGRLTAALVTVVLLIIATWDIGSRDQTSKHQEISVYRTGNGERSSITLSDGSTVVLNVASGLEVPVDYGRKSRSLKLVGQAFFTVTHNSNVPLTVTTSYGTAKVLGTKFTVREYSTDTAAVVAVSEGRVEVNKQILNAGQELSVNSVGVFNTDVADNSRFGFVSGMMTLKSIPLASAINDLNRWYNADIRLGNPSLDTLKVYGDFETGSLTDLTSILEMTFNVRVVRRDRVLTLYPRG